MSINHFTQLRVRCRFFLLRNRSWKCTQRRTAGNIKRLPHSETGAGWQATILYIIHVMYVYIYICMYTYRSVYNIIRLLYIITGFGSPHNQDHLFEAQKKQWQDKVLARLAIGKIRFGLFIRRNICGKFSGCHTAKMMADSGMVTPFLSMQDEVV